MGEEVRPGSDKWPKGASSPRKVGSQWRHVMKSLLLAKGGYWVTLRRILIRENRRPSTRGERCSDIVLNLLKELPLSSLRVL